MPPKRPIKPNSLRGRAWRALGEGAPELMDDVDFTMRKRPAAKPQQREKNEVQRPLVVYLRKHLPPGSLVHAQAIQPLNENHRFAMQRDGVQFGWPDVEVIVPGDALEGGPRYFHIECKRPDGGSLSPSQKHTQALMIAAGAAVLSECRSVSQAVEWLCEQGVQIR